MIKLLLTSCCCKEQMRVLVFVTRAEICWNKWISVITSLNKAPLSKTEKNREVFKRCNEKSVTERKAGLKMQLKILLKVHPVPRSSKVLLELHTHDLHTHHGSLLLMSAWCYHDLHLASGIRLPTKPLPHLSPQASSPNSRKGRNNKSLQQKPKQLKKKLCQE